MTAIKGKESIHKKIIVSRIPDAGQVEPITGQMSWVTQIFANLFSDHAVDKETIHGQATLQHHDGNVHMDGEIAFTHHPPCARCAENFARAVKVPLTTLLTAADNIHDEEALGDAKKSSRRGQKEDDAITLDDLMFSVFENDRFNLDEIIHDAIAVELPYNFYCREDCRGLCAQCGHNLNESLCVCPSPPHQGPQG